MYVAKIRGRFCCEIVQVSNRQRKLLIVARSAERKGSRKDLNYQVGATLIVLCAHVK